MNAKKIQPVPNPSASAMTDMVAYQAGSVVSHTILNKPSGSVTLFSFDAGESLSEHTAPFDAMVYILDGEALVTISGRANILQAGETLIMPAGEPHALQAVKRFKMLLIMIKS